MEDYQESMNHFKKSSNLIISSSVKSNPSSSPVQSELQNMMGGQETNENLIQ